MKGRKIIIILIIINLILVGTIYNLINKGNLSNKKQVIKEMTETEYEEYITTLNTSHEYYAMNIDEGKKQIATAITDMGVETSDGETLESMATNIRKLTGGLSGGISSFRILHFINGDKNSLKVTDLEGRTNCYLLLTAHSTNKNYVNKRINITSYSGFSFELIYTQEETVSVNNQYYAYALYKLKDITSEMSLTNGSDSYGSSNKIIFEI